MQTIKSNITRLKTKLSEVLPDGDDLFGYPGVSKSGLLALLERAHGHVARLEGLDKEVAIVMLKRKLSYPLGNAKQFLDDYANTSQAKEKFNRFLEDLAAIHDNVVLTYYIFADQTIRDQAQIELELSLVKGFEGRIQKLNADIEGYLQLVADSTNKLDEIAEAEESIQNTLEVVNASSSDVESAKSIITAAREVVNQYKTDAINSVEAINSASVKAAAASKRVTTLQGELSKTKEEIDKILLDAKDALDVNMRHLAAIESTVRDASKFGMASSFKARKEEQTIPMVIWGVAFLLSIVALVIFSQKYVLPEIPANGDFSDLSFFSIFLKVIVVAPFVWLGWMSAKQYSFLSRIREDYGYKYASALAFEGYKKEAVSIDEGMAKDLLKVAIFNLSLNPLRIYESGNVESSPIGEFLSSIFKRSPPGDKS